MKDKKTIILNTFTIVLFFVSVAVFGGTYETYNYYYRNYDGTFMLENLDGYELEFCRYFHEKNEEGEFIKGLYYSTENIKFIDKIENGRVVLTTYYDINSNIIHQRTNYYENGRMSAYKIIFYEKGRFFYSMNLLIYSEENTINLLTSFRVLEKTIDENSVFIIFHTVLYFNNNRPSFSIINSDISDGMQYLNNIAESYLYSNDELVEYNIINTDDDITLYREITSYENDTKKIIHSVANDENGNILVTKTLTQCGNNYTEEHTVNNIIFLPIKYTEINIAEGLQKRIMGKNVMLRTQDESIQINENVVPVNTRLLFEFDSFFRIPFLPTEYIGPMIMLNQ